MNKIEKNKAIILAFLEQYSTYIPVNVRDCENEIIADLLRNHYQLIRIGWGKDDDFIHHTIFHFDIKPDGKVWIQANWTDIDVAQELVERGLEKSDIVIGFQPPRHRQYTGYAVA
jgi:hypothetical protein